MIGANFGGQFGVLKFQIKLKTFAWRASRNILPTKVNVCDHRVLENPTSEESGLAEKTSGHFFWDCAKAHEVWEATCIPFDNRGVHCRNFIDLIGNLSLCNMWERICLN